MISRAKLPIGMSWEQLASLGPTEVRDRNLFPKGFYPLPHPNQPGGGMVFEIDKVKNGAT